VKEEKVKKIVRKGYAKIAKQTCSCCGGAEPQEISKSIGYSDEELSSVPEGANLGLGCGNPVALASLKEGEAVLDLGSGAGLDCFLAASRVGDKGKVIGVDMTPEMIERSRENARKSRHRNIEFRLGEIENLPVADNSVDVVISNCVINLSTDKKRVFEEAFRVLKPGGRLMVSDIVLLAELPEVIKRSVKAYVGCLSGAIMKDRYLETMREAGFQGVKIIEESHFPVKFMASDPTAKAVKEQLGMSSEDVEKIASTAASIKVYGLKPAK
jgi:ubiquinone/menaquinone biosynthesis C-methylase UbiE